MSNQIQQVKEASDIVSVIGERISLTRSGRNFKGLCPFHSEKSPSFFVSPDIQVFRCFGCGERGDVITFLEKYDGLTFAEALELLAQKAGITLEKFQKSQEDTVREELKAILELTKEYYHYLLIKHPIGEAARDYLKQRKTFQESINLFQLGYSLPSWDGLIKYLVGKKKLDIRAIEKAGLVILRSGRKPGSPHADDYYDRFRDRVMFPLADHRGRVVGFSGRVLSSDVKEAKYINTPETQLYHKSQLLFGFSQHFHSIREAQNVIVVEGEFDVISSDQAHVTNVVAIKGSALTREHVELLRRTVETITLSLDADKAGVEATKRGIQIVQQFSDVRLRILPSYLFDGKDPDDLARENPGKWREVVKQSVSVYQFLIDVAIRQNDLSTGEGKQNVMNEVGPVLAQIPQAIERQYYLTQLAKALEMPEAVIQQDVIRLKTAKDLSFTKKIVEKQEESETDSQTTLEQLCLSLLVQFPDDQVIPQAKKLAKTDFSLPAHQNILEHIQQQSVFELKKFSKSLPPELETAFSSLYFAHLQDAPTTSKEFEEVLLGVRSLGAQQRVKALTSQLQQLEAKDHLTPEEDARTTQLLQEIVQLRGK